MSKAKAGVAIEAQIGWLQAWQPDTWNRGQRPRQSRVEVKAAGIADSVEALRSGKVPLDFPWLEKVVAVELGADGPNMPTRLMAVIEELARVQDTDPRNAEYEQRVRAMGRVLTDTRDCDGNLLGFCAQVQTTDGVIHPSYYGDFTLGEDIKWRVLVQDPNVSLARHIQHVAVPITQVRSVVPWPAP